MERRETYEERIATLTETMDYAARVVAKMPGDTLAERKRRWLRYAAILDEWHKARLRWKIIHP